MKKIMVEIKCAREWLKNAPKCMEVNVALAFLNQIIKKIESKL